jgi:hypothetical protein
MKLGFIKSDADSNLYYKVVEGDTLILVQETAINRVRDERSRIDALLSRSGDMAEARCDTGESGEVHGLYIEEIWYDAL